MKRVLDFIKALGAFQGKRYDHSYIGRVSIAFWGEEDASWHGFPATVSGRKKAWNACAWKQRTRQESLWVFWKLGFSFLPISFLQYPNRILFQWGLCGRPIPVSRSFSLPRKQGT